MPKSGIPGLYSNFVSSYLKNLHTDFYSERLYSTSYLFLFLAWIFRTFPDDSFWFIGPCSNVFSIYNFIVCFSLSLVSLGFVNIAYWPKGSTPYWLILCFCSFSLYFINLCSNLYYSCCPLLLGLTSSQLLEHWGEDSGYVIWGLWLFTVSTQGPTLSS